MLPVPYSRHTTTTCSGLISLASNQSNFTQRPRHQFIVIHQESLYSYERKISMLDMKLKTCLVVGCGMDSSQHQPTPLHETWHWPMYFRSLILLLNWAYSMKYLKVIIHHSATEAVKLIWEFVLNQENDQ